MSTPVRFTLPQSEIPKAWYNLAADFPEPLPPPLNPETKEPVSPDVMTAIFPENLVEQEISTERYIEIPDPVREILALWRPTPLRWRNRTNKRGLSTLPALDSEA